MTTREQAIALMLDWAEGRLSHWNMITRQTSPGQYPAATAHCAMADAMEVVKWSAVAQVLPALAADTEPEGKHG